MEKQVLSYPNDRIAIICELNDNRNNTYTILPIEMSIGRLDEKGNFISENDKYIVPSLESYEALNNPDNKYFYAFVKRLSDLDEIYPKISVPEIKMSLYYREISSKFNLAVVSNDLVKIYSSDYSAISPEIVGEYRKKIDITASKKEASKPEIIIPSEQDLTRIDNFGLESYLKERIISNDSVIEDICTTIAMNYRARFANEVESLLSVGTTGTGKTETYRLIAEYLSVPLTIFDCKSLTANGYVGLSITDALKSVYYSSNEDIKKAEKSILVLDEIDKLASRGNDVNDVSVQESLLKMLDGYIYDVEVKKNLHVRIDSSFMTIAALGAFQDLFNNKTNHKSMGFMSTTEEGPKDITIEDFVKYGMKAELMGRFKNISYYKTLTKDELKLILTSSKTSALIGKVERYKREFNASLEWDEEFINELVEEAIKYNTGGRSLDLILSYIFKKIDREMLAREKTEPGVSKKLILTQDTVHDNTKYKI